MIPLDLAHLANPNCEICFGLGRTGDTLEDPRGKVTHIRCICTLRPYKDIYNEEDEDKDTDEEDDNASTNQ